MTKACGFVDGTIKLSIAARLIAIEAYQRAVT
jgi:hypothetical protein